MAGKFIIFESSFSKHVIKRKIFKVAIKNRYIIYSETKIMTTDFSLERMQVRR